MNSRKLFALFLAFALMGSALAAQRDNVYRNDEQTAEGVTAVQQHTVFVEIIKEKQANVNDTEIHEFAAVVGLVKECVKRKNVDRFDNAVLWFNDQFLFGEKDKRKAKENVTDKGLGFNPNETNVFGDDEGFAGAHTMDERWGGCFIPDGFVHAIGKDDPFGCGAEAGIANFEEATVDCGTLGYSSNIDLVKDLIQLDQDCLGCIFEYQGSFFVTDPNGHDWIVDKHVYPLSVMGNLFQEQTNSDQCASDANGTLPFSDPRDSGPHHNVCNDHPNEEDEKNHCDDSDGDGDCFPEGDDHEDPQGTTLVEPLFTVHQQVNETTGQGFADRALYRTDKGTTDDPTDDELRKGAPYPRAGIPKGVGDDGLYDTCVGNNDGEPGDTFNSYKNLSAAEASKDCTLEYTFLIAVDFAAFDTSGLQNDAGEVEINRGDKEHGEGGADQDDRWWEGNSHPHNGGEACDGDADGDGIDEADQPCESPQHDHNTVNLDLFFTEESGVGAPYFIEQNPVTDDNGDPYDVGPDCAHAANFDNGSPEDQSITARTPIVCDIDNSGYHAHDGSQTVDP